MKFYEITGNAEYGEQPAKDSRTGESVTLTDKRAALMAGDYISVYRCEVVPNEDNETPTETAFQFLVMNSSGSLAVYVCDFETGAQVIEQNLHPLLRGNMNCAELDEILNRLQNEYSGNEGAVVAKLNLKDLKQRFRAQPDNEEYTAQNGRRCLRTVGNYAWFALLCEQAGIEPRWIESGLYATADGDGFSLSYCEHDVTLAFEQTDA